MTRGSYIAIAGNIGAGKTSMVEYLTGRYPIRPIYEPNAENPFLADFYEDMARWAFHSQIHFLARKLPLQRALRDEPDHVLQDRTIWEDAEIFARHLASTGSMTEREYATYRAIFEASAVGLRPPDLLVYLRCDVRTLRRRIRARGRSMERQIAPRYLRALHALYEDWFDRYTLSTKVVLETNELDPVTDLVHSHEVHRAIERFL